MKNKLFLIAGLVAATGFVALAQSQPAPATPVAPANPVSAPRTAVSPAPNATVSGFTPNAVSGFAPNPVSGLTPNAVSGFNTNAVSGFQQRPVNSLATNVQVSPTTPVRPLTPSPRASGSRVQIVSPNVIIVPQTRLRSNARPVTPLPPP
ncbi:MAG: hypothetical protein ABJC04_13590 [Verrucomicrobiota bacterium]